MTSRLSSSDGPVVVSRTPSPDLRSSGSWRRTSREDLVTGVSRLFLTPAPQPASLQPTSFQPTAFQQSSSSSDRPASPPRQVRSINTPIATSSSQAVLPFGFHVESQKITDDIPRDYSALYARIDLCDPYKGDALKMHEDCKVAKAFENAVKNRYSNAIPTDASRICLQRIIDETDYVNASFFKGMILTQGPRDTTLAAFWTMLFEQNSKSLVCLTGHLEPNRQTQVPEEKTYPYWNPTLRSSAPGQMKKGAELFSQSDIELRVVCETDPECVLPNTGQNDEHVIKQTFSITLGKTTKHICFFHYVNWVDHSGADVKALVAFVKILRAYGGPFAFNCSAGVGRSGTLAVLMDLIYTYEASKRIPTERDVLEAILSLRKVRLGGCITGPVQLRTLFEALREYIQTI